MDIENMKRQLLEIMENYFVICKLQNNNDMILKIDECDYSIYDAYDYNCPPCYSVIIKNKDIRYFIKGSINVKDGECVLEIIYNNEKAGNYLIDTYKRYEKDNLIRSGWANFTYYNKSILECLIYFNREQEFFEILENYLKLSF